MKYDDKMFILSIIGSLLIIFGGIPDVITHPTWYNIIGIVGVGLFLVVFVIYHAGLVMRIYNKNLNLQNNSQL
jgi:hypothetical protein